ncbi:MAG TPA: transglycosylase SLT domain-containing protein [Bryobacteraceae bacterium]|nr:transglycosylase SLT domain-containing protein [Bryobacteraceae bacterium]
MTVGVCLPAISAVPRAPADAGPKDATAAGLIAIAQRQLEARNYSAAITYATQASSKKSVIEDYSEWIRAQAEYAVRNYEEVSRSVTRIFNQAPLSPFVGSAAALATRASLDNDKPKDGLELIRKYYEQIPRPQRDLLLARCFQATGDLPQAAEYYQRVYYGYPTAKEAADAADALVEVKKSLGDAYPPVMPSAMLERAQKLFEAKKAAAAKLELAAAIPQLGGAERDLARVRLGVADFLSKNTAAAFQYLSALKVDDPEADAERLNYVVQSARKLDRHANVKPFLNDLEKSHPTSLWRMSTLILVADQARTDNDRAMALGLYQACATTFGKEEKAGWCQWQVTFDAYKRDASDAYDLLRAFLHQYPGSQDANDALYFLGRLNERKGDFASARACYERLTGIFPNTYYAVLARQRLDDVNVKAATATPAVAEFLMGIDWPGSPEFPSFVPGSLAQSRIDRARLLQLAGLDDLAESEVKFGGRNDGEQENVYALELARMAAARGEKDQAIRYIKSYAPDYLYMPLDQAPVEFWQLAFPIPFRQSIEQYSRAEGLDPFVVAALIRQESEFNAKVVSHANAYGLMQLLPATGRELSRRLRLGRFSTAQLLVADRNVRLGTYFFHNLLNSYDGQIEIALASYNAGPGRANVWRTWGPFREQAEFIEAVPFHETRGYIQIVLRNADVYRRLYSGRLPDVPEYHPKPAPKTKPKRRQHAR